jgi:hypothetical protein
LKIVVDAHATRGYLVNQEATSFNPKPQENVMARLSKHGEEIGRVYFTTSVRAYMSDGTILQNDGTGWKVRGKSSDIRKAYADQVEKQNAVLSQRPCFNAYRKELRNLTGIGKAWKLHSAIQVLGDDVDGIWSECCDGYGDNVHASVDEVARLVRLYNNAVAEKRETLYA